MLVHKIISIKSVMDAATSSIAGRLHRTAPTQAPAGAFFMSRGVLEAMLLPGINHHAVASVGAVP